MLCVALAAASSFPNGIKYCDVDAPLGEGLEFMTWVRPAVRTDAFTLRSGDGCGGDPTTYIPGQFTSIHVRTHKYKGQFRGILLYATDMKGARVGDWQLDWPNSNMFWKPPQAVCQNKSLMHLNGAEKYYHHEFKFISPPAGTGPIEFHCLIKRGQANTGEFYHPNLNKNLILNEASPASGNIWVEGPVGSSCSQTCSSMSPPRTCDSALLNNAFKWSGALQKDVLLSVGCASPALTSQFATTVSKDPSGWCTYPSPLAPMSTGACDAVPSNGSTPVCPCGSAGLPSFGNAVPPPATACLNSFVMLGSASKASSSVVSLLMLITGLFFNRRSNFLVSLVCILFCAYTVQAHNWVYSVSRSFNQASTYKPCRPRVNDVPHWQINEGQEFTMEWATGHDFYFYFTVVNAEDIDKLENTTEDDLDDYIKGCLPTDDYMVKNPTHWAKQHIDSNPKGMTDYVTSTGGRIYSGNISTTDSNYIVRHPKFGVYNNEVRWVYSNENTVNDKRCSYFNPTLPYIIAVHRFVQVETVMSRAGDRDIARFTIELSPTHKANGYGSGQYILQYLWRGYFDCADVDLFPASIPINTSLIGGRPIRSDEPQWNKVDHCQFEEVQGLQTGCYEVTTTADRCLSNCLAQMDCGGVNVVPMWLPRTVYPRFSDRVAIPWDNDNQWRGCMQQDFAELSRDARVCYGLVPRQPNNTHASYSVTDDPEDPVFYATCFVKKPQWTFDLSLNTSGVAVAPIPPAWAFADKCVDCMEWKSSQVTNIIPTWNLPETCVNCETAALPPIPDFPGSLISRGSKCDGSYDGKTIWNFHNVSSACAKKRCVKTLSLVGVNDIRADECIAKARADPECSEFVQYQGNVKLNWWEQTGCECFVKDSCCGTCVPADADFRNWEWNIYSTKTQTQTTGDPACANGVKSLDGVYCCSASCKDKNGVASCMPRPALQVSFQSSAMNAPDGWGVDNGLKYGNRTTPGYTSTLSEYGWNCDGLSQSSAKDFETADGTNYHSTYIEPDSKICVTPTTVLPTWTVKVPNGDYQVDTLYAKPWQWMTGCTIQDSKTPNYDAISHERIFSYNMAWVSRTVTATSGQISLIGGTNWPQCGSYSAVVIYPKSSVPSNTYCQSLPGMCCPLFIDMENRPCSRFEAPCKIL